MMAWIRRQFNSLAVRLLWPAALMMIVMVVVLMTVVTRTYTNTILEQEASKTQAAFNIAAGSVGALIDTTEALGASMMQTDRVQRYAQDDYVRASDKILARWEMLESVGALLDQNPDVYGLIFMREDGTVFGSLPYRSYFFEDENSGVADEGFLSGVRSIRRGSCHWIGPVSGKELYRLGEEFDRAPRQVMLGVSYNRSIVYGTVYSIVVLDTAKLDGLLGLLRDGRSSYHLVSGDGISLAADGEALSAEVWAGVDTGKRSGSAPVKKENGEWSHVSWRRIDSLGWYLVRDLPMAEYDRTVNELKRYVLGAALAVFAAAMLVYLIWLGSFMRSFRALRTAIRRLGEGRLETRIERPFVITEFEEIRREFNGMNSELESLVQTTRAMERDRLELELRALQTQLSPHMIFNSITAIRWMATMLGADRVSDMLMELSEMLRPVFRDWAIEWTLGEELQHLSHYANLLDLRYGNNFSLNVDVPEEMLSQRLPRFTLQPLVENACEHGGASSARLHVSICARTEAGRCVISVRDDGTGMDQETIDQIRERLASGSRTQRVGLYSVHNRLRICMGDSSRMTVDSLPEGGAEITVSWELMEKIL